LKNQLKQKNCLIKTLEAKLATTMEAAKDKVSVGIEQARLANKSEIELLKTKLEQAQLVVRDGQMQVSQQKYLIKQLQARVEVTESKVINIRMFQSQAMEIQSRVSAAQQNLLTKVEVIRDNCLLVNQVLEDLTVIEREAGETWFAFQEAVIATNNMDLGNTPRFTISEQTRGNILLK
jgi:multidrug efflux pump subunit AcrA (membrane-fusion protein)